MRGSVSCGLAVALLWAGAACGGGDGGGDGRASEASGPTEDAEDRPSVMADADDPLVGTNSSSGPPMLMEPPTEDDDDDPAPMAPPEPQLSQDCSACEQERIGAGGDSPFDVAANPSERVAVDPADGALVLESPLADQGELMWVADTNLPGVVKIDLSTMAIVGHYYTGGGSTSRTTVNALGHAFVASRTNGPHGNAGVTKILPDGADCPDTNGDGVITTSAGEGDVLPWGEDDCVLWHRELGGDIRGLAAQDLAGLQPAACEGFDADSQRWSDEPAQDVPDRHYVWAGGLHGRIYKLDADSGDVLVDVSSPSPVYGGALDGAGRFWISKTLGYLDTLRCTDSATCEAEPVCSSGDWVAFDACVDSGAVKGLKTGTSGYGITVDCKQRVWLSNTTQRYDPALPTGSRHASAAGLAGSGAGGIAADAAGWIWASDGASTARVDSDTLEGIEIAAPDKGVAVASDGRVITVRDRGVHVIEPGAALGDFNLSNDVVTLPGFAYAYSDMTGLQTRLAVDEPGFYRQVFEGCGVDELDTVWHELVYDADVPEGTSLQLSVRSADTLEALGAEGFRTVACDAAGDGEQRSSLAGTRGRYVEVELRLTGSTGADPDGQRGCQTGATTTARVRSFGPIHECPTLPPVEEPPPEEPDVPE